jgi:hypothetical protein
VGRELLDDPGADPVAVATSLGNVARANHWFGGRAAVRYALGELLRRVRPGRILTLLDIGTGVGDLPADARAWAARRGISLVPLGLERSRVAARLAAEAGIPTAVGCLGTLPVARRGVDIVLLSQVAHHFAPDAAVALFRAASEAARFGVVVADLRRSALAVPLFRLGATALRFDPETRADGVTSIRRGYTADELATILRRAGVVAHIRRRPGFRLAAWWHTN